MLNLLEFRTKKDMKLGEGLEIYEKKKERRNTNVTGIGLWEKREGYRSIYNFFCRPSELQSCFHSFFTFLYCLHKQVKMEGWNIINNPMR